MRVVHLRYLVPGTLDVGTCRLESPYCIGFVVDNGQAPTNRGSSSDLIDSTGRERWHLHYINRDGLHVDIPAQDLPFTKRVSWISTPTLDRLPY